MSSDLTPSRPTTTYTEATRPPLTGVTNTPDSSRTISSGTLLTTLTTSIPSEDEDTIVYETATDELTLTETETVPVTQGPSTTTGGHFSSIDARATTRPNSNGDDEVTYVTETDDLTMEPTTVVEIEVATLTDYLSDDNPTLAPKEPGEPVPLIMEGAGSHVKVNSKLLVIPVILFSLFFIV